MISGSIQEEYVKLNIYALNVGALQCIRQMLMVLKGEINSTIIIVGDFNSVIPKDRSAKQKINKETQALNDTLNQIDLIGIYRTFMGFPSGVAQW